MYPPLHGSQQSCELFELGWGGELHPLPLETEYIQNGACLFCRPCGLLFKQTRSLNREAVDHQVASNHREVIGPRSGAGVFRTKLEFTSSVGSACESECRTGGATERHFTIPQDSGIGRGSYCDRARRVRHREVANQL